MPCNIRKGVGQGRQMRRSYSEAEGRWTSVHQHFSVPFSPQLFCHFHPDLARWEHLDMSWGLWTQTVIQYKDQPGVPPTSPVLLNRGTCSDCMGSKCTQTFIPSCRSFHQEEELQFLVSFNSIGQEKPWRKARESLYHQQEPGLRTEELPGGNDPFWWDLRGNALKVTVPIYQSGGTPLLPFS